MNDQVSKEEFEDALNDVLCEWKTVLGCYKCGLRKSLSIFVEKDDSIQYRVVVNSEQAALTYRSSEALDAYNSAWD